jgi:hypothetical protein
MESSSYAAQKHSRTNRVVIATTAATKAVSLFRSDEIRFVVTDGPEVARRHI